MLELSNISHALGRSGGEEGALLGAVSFRAPGGHFMAIVGPSGCGKSTLLKVIAGIWLESDGELRWQGRLLATHDDLAPTELGYVPQFSIAHDPLSVVESVDTAARLRARWPSAATRRAHVDSVLEQTGLTGLADQRVGTLSGGQKRRLGLAIELVTDPHLLLCDEVTSGLDPLAEGEITRLLRALSRQEGRLVINVTHSLDQIALYDSVLVLTHGRVAFHGPPNRLSHWFSAEAPEEIYQNLAATSPDDWHRTWRKNHAPYYRKLDLPSLDEPWPAPAPAIPQDPAPETDTPATDPPSLEPPGSSIQPPGSSIQHPAPSIQDPAPRIQHPGSSTQHPPSTLPSAPAQFGTLLARRVRLFFRDRSQLLLHLLLLLGFPCLVVIFASHGVGQMPKRLDFSDVRTASDYLMQTRLIEQQVKTGGLISSLVLMQVILLALMGTNNAAREIAGERMLFEKEKLGGVRPGAYVLSKVVFLACLVAVQSIWMGFFVHFFCRLPGDFPAQVMLLVGLNAAMTFLCLGLSSLARSPEQASLLGIYLAGFQLPLSGAVLRLPEKIEALVRPLISAYWSWAGQLETMKPSDAFIGIRAAVPTSLVPSWDIALWVLAAQALAGLWVAWLGCRRHGWE